MAFFDKIKYIASGGKSNEERRMIAEANAQIRKEALAAELEERKRQNIILARERVRVNAERKLKTIRGNTSPVKSVSSAFGINLNDSRYKSISEGLKNRKRWDPIFGGYR